jgi:Zn-dependent peptidase ImmA (M78 family)
LNTFSRENIDRINRLAQNVRIKNDAMEWGVSPEFFIEREGLQCSEYNLNEEGFFRKYIKTPLMKIGQLIKAAIIIKEKVVLIDEDLHHAKKPFGKLHELGHHVILEHREIFYVCSEHDLRPDTRREIEFEANVFASELLCPSALLKSIHTEYPLCMETVMQLKQLSSGSIHASAIKYVTTSDKECCLLILHRDGDEEHNPGLRLERQICSETWVRKYGGKCFEEQQFLPQDHVISRAAFFVSMNDIYKGTVSLRDTKTVFRFNSIYNSYKLFALVFE